MHFFLDIDKGHQGLATIIKISGVEINAESGRRIAQRIYVVVDLRDLPSAVVVL